MKKILLIAMILMLLVIFGCKPKANAAMIDPSLGWSPQFTFPMDTGVDGFWFPGAKDDEPKFAIGTSVTAARMTIPAVTFMTIDGNLLVAKSFDSVDDPMYGLGIKGSVNLFKIKVTEALELFPSLGIGFVNNFQNMSTWDDLIDGFRVTVYGTAGLYKFK